MKVETVLKYSALIGVAFVATKFALKVAEGVKAGKEVLGAVTDTLVKTVTEDLNPASDKNVVYSAVNAAGRQITSDPSFNLGGSLWEFWNGKEFARKAGLAPDSSDTANTSKQIEQMEKAQDDFRRAEIKAENTEAAKAAATEEQMSRSKTNFRLSEITQQNGSPYTTDFDRLLQTIAGQR